MFVKFRRLNGSFVIVVNVTELLGGNMPVMSIQRLQQYVSTCVRDRRRRCEFNTINFRCWFNSDNDHRSSV